MLSGRGQCAFMRSPSITMGEGRGKLTLGVNVSRVRGSWRSGAGMVHIYERAGLAGQVPCGGVVGVARGVGRVGKSCQDST